MPQKYCYFFATESNLIRTSNALSWLAVYKMNYKIQRTTIVLARRVQKGDLLQKQTLWFIKNILKHFSRILWRVSVAESFSRTLSPIRTCSYVCTYSRRKLSSTTRSGYKHCQMVVAWLRMREWWQCLHVGVTNINTRDYDVAGSLNWNYEIIDICLFSK